MAALSLSNYPRSPVGLGSSHDNERTGEIPASERSYMRNILRALSGLGMAAGLWVMIDLGSGPSGVSGDGVGSLLIVVLIFTLACFVVFRLCKGVKPNDRIEKEQSAPDGSR
jgi:hypothetical protein